MSGDEFSQTIEGYFVIDPLASGEIEIRLTNTILNESRSYILQVESWANDQYWVCHSLDPTYQYRLQGYNSTNPNVVYHWDFPAGIIANNVNIQNPNFSYGSYSGPMPPVAKLHVTNDYCAASYYVNVPLDPAWWGCYARPANSNGGTRTLTSTAGEIASKLVISPNPATNILQLKTSRKITGVQVYSIDGKRTSISTLTGGYTQVNVSRLNPGSYIVVVEYADRTKETRLFIKH
jgi:hypothetical protein